ncbi:hypothetical protein ACNSOL_02890 [Aliarcobacter lanthieri]|uniref:hypothetical protein n=1 Tax=Aliarcobacter lanthieri TaxID=1355374 RepID=UPI003AAC321E
MNGNNLISKKVAIAGASGLVGHYLLEGLIKDESVSEIHAYCRKDLKIKHPKIIVHLVDFNNLPTFPIIDELYLAIGTTKKQAGNQENYRAIDFTVNLNIAQKAISSGVKSIALVSAIGADAKSKIFYNRLKGELEDALIKLAPEKLLIVRPSFLLGNRIVLGQKERFSEKLVENFSKILKFLFPINLKPIKAKSVADFILSELQNTKKNRIVLSSEIQKFEKI